MSRYFNLLLWFAFGFGLAAAPMFAFASIQSVNIPNYVRGPSGNYYQAGSATGQQLIQYTPTSTVNASVRVPVTPGLPVTRAVTVPVRVPVNAARVAAATIAIVKSVGPVGLGLALLPVVCEVTQICQSSTDPSTLVKTNPSTQPGSFPSCAAAAGYCNSSDSAISGTWFRIVSGFVAPSGCVAIKFVAWDYPAGVYDCSGAPLPPAEAPVTDSDLAAAAAALAAATASLNGVVDKLTAAGKPIPVDDPQSDPLTSTSPSTTTVNRDPTGAVTSTTTTTVTTNISPVSNTSTSTTSNVTQNISTSVTNNSGTSVSVTTAEPPEPEDPEIEFDTVDDVPLEEQELPLSMPAATSWGEGSCPPDPSVSVMGHPIAIPVHVVCDYMIGVRMAVIAFFALISAYIVIGVKFEG